MVFVVEVFVLLVGTIGFAFTCQLGFTDALYVSVVTATTVGYGDITAENCDSTVGKNIRLSFAILYILFGTATIISLLGVLIEAFFSHRQEKMVERVFGEMFDPSFYFVLDKDGDGKVTWSEFLEWTLVNTNKVSAIDVQMIRDKFNHLDREKKGVITYGSFSKVAGAAIN